MSATTNGHTQPSNDVYWTTNDPRNTGVIGYEGAKPVFFRFVSAGIKHVWRAYPSDLGNRSRPPLSTARAPWYGRGPTTRTLSTKSPGTKFPLF
jgi:hypothetical protein